jgi:hypothetical protein
VAVNWKSFAVLGILAAASQAWSLDSFDINVENWKNGSAGGPQWSSSGGVSGGCLANISSGLSSGGGKQVMYNTTQWAFNYTAAGVTELQFYARTTYTAGSLNLRLAVQGAGGAFSSTNAASLANDGQWHLLTLGLQASDLTYLSGGTGVAGDTLAGITMLRLIASDVPSFSGAQIAAIVFYDNITYSTGPPSTITNTPTPSPTYSTTSTQTVSPTFTVTWSESPTFSVSPTRTVTPTMSATPTISPTLTESPTSTASPTLTPFTGLHLGASLGGKPLLGPVPAKSGQALCLATLANSALSGHLQVFNTALQRVAWLPLDQGRLCWDHVGLSPGVYWVRHELTGQDAWVQKIVILP